MFMREQLVLILVHEREQPASYVVLLLIVTSHYLMVNSCLRRVFSHPHIFVLQIGTTSWYATKN